MVLHMWNHGRTAGEQISAHIISYVVCTPLRLKNWLKMYMQTMLIYKMHEHRYPLGVTKQRETPCVRDTATSIAWVVQKTFDVKLIQTSTCTTSVPGQHFTQLPRWIKVACKACCQIIWHHLASSVSPGPRSSRHPSSHPMPHRVSEELLLWTFPKVSFNSPNSVFNAWVGWAWLGIMFGQQDSDTIPMPEGGVAQEHGIICRIVYMHACKYARAYNYGKQMCGACVS